MHIPTRFYWCHSMLKFESIFPLNCLTYHLRCACKFRIVIRVFFMSDSGLGHASVKGLSRAPFRFYVYCGHYLLMQLSAHFPTFVVYPAIISLQHHCTLSWLLRVCFWLIIYSTNKVLHKHVRQLVFLYLILCVTMNNKCMYR